MMLALWVQKFPTSFRVEAKIHDEMEIITK